MSATISGEELDGFFAALFGQPGAASATLERLGPALGIYPAPSDEEDEPKNRAVFTLMRQKLDGLPVPASASVLHRYLDHEVGLTGPLAALFILLFAYHERPELALQLNGSGQIELADGRPFLATRITPDLIPSLRWDEQLADRLHTIGTATPPSWSDARQHLAALCPDIADTNGPGIGCQEVNEQLLADALAAMRRDIEAAASLLRRLNAAEPASRPPGSDEAQAAIGTLAESISRLAQVSEERYDGVYLSIRRVYSSLNRFEEDLAALADLARWDKRSEEIFQAQEYLAGATVPPALQPGLAVERDALWNQVSPASVARNRGRGWESSARDVAGFRETYGKVYRDHHAAFYNALPHFQLELESVRRKSAALELFNTLPELGDPAGAGLAEDLPRLEQGLGFCPKASADLDLTSSPHCSRCHLSLEQTLPTGQLARVTPMIDAALSQKTRALSSQLVGKVLDGRYDPRLDEFLKIVQASELSSLANTLDPELLTFIRQVLD